MLFCNTASWLDSKAGSHGKRKPSRKEIYVLAGGTWVWVCEVVRVRECEAPTDLIGGINEIFYIQSSYSFFPNKKIIIRIKYSIIILRALSHISSRKIIKWSSDVNSIVQMEKQDAYFISSMRRSHKFKSTSFLIPTCILSSSFPLFWEFVEHFLVGQAWEVGKFKRLE